MAIKVVNNAASKLITSLSATDQYMAVTPGDGAKFPVLAAGDYTMATIFDIYGNMEIVKVTARAADTMVIERGQEGTQPTEFAIGARVECRYTAGMYRLGLEAANIVTDLKVTAHKLPEGRDPTVDYSPANYTMDFGIPEGPTGPQGPEGKPFTVSRTYSSIEEMLEDYPDDAKEGEYAIISCDVDDEDNGKAFVWRGGKWVFITDMSGPQGVTGPQGEQGETGPAATIEIGEVTTGEPGTPAEVHNVGDEHHAVFDFVLPRSEGATYAFGRFKIDKNANLTIAYYGEDTQDEVFINDRGEAVVRIRKDR